MFFDPWSAGASLALGGIQTLFGHNQAQEQADRQNAANQAAYRQQLRMRNAQIVQQDGAYNLKVAAYNDKLFNLSQNANMTYQQEQLRQNEMWKQSKFARQAENIALAKSQGKLGARGRTGKSAARAMALDAASYGRNQAIRAQSLFSAGVASDMRNKATGMKLDAARRAAHANVAYAPARPLMPLEPTEVQGPSNLNLFTGFLGNLGSAFETGASVGRQNQQLYIRNPGTPG